MVDKPDEPQPSTEAERVFSEAVDKMIDGMVDGMLPHTSFEGQSTTEAVTLEAIHAMTRPEEAPIDTFMRHWWNERAWHGCVPLYDPSNAVRCWVLILESYQRSGPQSTRTHTLLLMPGPKPLKGEPPRIDSPLKSGELDLADPPKWGYIAQRPDQWKDLDNEMRP